jgi:hypothetical protein
LFLYFPNFFIIRLAFLSYFPNHCTIFFHIFPIFSLFSSVFSKSFHYSTYLSSIFSKSFHYSTYLSSIFSNVFQLSETIINSYDIFFMYKRPCYNCNIVECGIKHPQPNPLFTKTYTYLPIYIFIRIMDFIQFFASYFPILMSFKSPQYNLFYITA